MRDFDMNPTIPTIFEQLADIPNHRIVVLRMSDGHLIALRVKDLPIGIARLRADRIPAENGYVVFALPYAKAWHSGSYLPGGSKAPARWLTLMPVDLDEKLLARANSLEALSHPMFLDIEMISFPTRYWEIHGTSLMTYEDAKKWTREHPDEWKAWEKYREAYLTKYAQREENDDE